MMLAKNQGMVHSRNEIQVAVALGQGLGSILPGVASASTPAMPVEVTWLWALMVRRMR